MELLLQIDGSTQPSTEEITQAIGKAGGRVLHAWPPYALIIDAQEAIAAELKSLPGVVAAYSAEVPVSSLDAAPEPFKLAAAVWNSRLSKRSTRSAEGLSWDAPGHLPPDPPPSIQEMLRRREKEGL